MSSTPAERLGAGRYLTAGNRPESVITTVHELTTADGATVRGVLATVPGATTVVSLMHPRQDLTCHPLVPLLLQAGAEPPGRGGAHAGSTRRAFLSCWVMRLSRGTPATVLYQTACRHPVARRSMVIAPLAVISK